jgi:hypothetical protein
MDHDMNRAALCRQRRRAQRGGRLRLAAAMAHGYQAHAEAPQRHREAIHGLVVGHLLLRNCEHATAAR